MFLPRNSKGGIGSLFDPCVNAMRRRPYCPSGMEASYCTFGFGMIFTHYRYRVIHRAITYMLAWFWVHAEKATHALQNYLAGLAAKKSGGTITHLHTRWPPQQTPLFNFLGFYTTTTPIVRVCSFLAIYHICLNFLSSFCKTTLSCKISWRLPKDWLDIL